MLEQDYLMRMLLAFYQAMNRSVERRKEGLDPKEALDILEDAIGSATDIDGKTLLSLAPESMASMLQVTGTDPRVAEYIGRSLLLSSQYQSQLRQTALAGVRAAQAQALADAFGFDLPDDPEDLSGLPGAPEPERDDAADDTSGDALSAAAGGATSDTLSDPASAVEVDMAAEEPSEPQAPAQRNEKA